jgi:hypothetical protein
MIGEHDTDHGRLPRCQAFDQQVREIRGDRSDIYPVTMEFKEGERHSGLPDRNKIRDMYPATRDPIPRDLVWEPTDRALKSFHWLHVPGAKEGMLLEASCHDNHIKLQTTGVGEVRLLLDERLIDYDRPVVVDFNGNVSEHRLEPSLTTFIDTLVERGDPHLAAFSRVVLKGSEQAEAAQAAN